MSVENQERFRDTLGVTTRAPEPTLGSLRPEADGARAAALAERGEAIRADLTASLDADYLADRLDELATAFDELPAIREMGTPEQGQTPYQELTPAAWDIVEHLTEAGFFQAAEDNLPAFSAEHIQDTTEELLRMDSLTETLSRLSLDDDEQLALVSNIVNSREQLGWWQRTPDYPDVAELDRDDYDDGIVHDYVPPLHQRALEGSLLWIDGLDWHLWQKAVLITDEMVEKCVWDVKTMLAGAYLFGDAARRVAEDDISDEGLTTMITASSATMILGQEFLVDDVAWITDDNRKPAEEW